MKKQRLSCAATSIVLALAFLPFYSRRALEYTVHLFTPTLHIFHRTHSLARSLFCRSISHT